MSNQPTPEQNAAAEKIAGLQHFTNVETTSDFDLPALAICLTAIFLSTWGSPDLLDALVHWLMKP